MENENKFQTRADGDAFLKQMQSEIDAENAAKAEAQNLESQEKEADVVKTEEVDTTKEVVVSEEKEIIQTEPVKNWKDLLDEELALKAAEDKRKEYDELLEDDLAKTLLEAKKQGKDIKSVLKALSETDPSSFSEKQLFEMVLNGEKGEDGQPLTQADIDEKYEQFQTLPKSAQEKLIKSQKIELEQKFNEATKALKSNPQNPYLESAKKANEDLLVAVDQLAGKKVFGAEVTHKIAKELYVEAKEQLKTAFNGKEFNVSAALEKAIAIKMLPYLVSDAAKKANTEAKLELFKQFNTPSASGKPVVTTEQLPKSKDQLEQEKFDAHAARHSDPMGIRKN